MANLNNRLGRASSGATVQTAPPAASDKASLTAWGEFTGGAADVMRGRVSLIMLNTLILLLLVFYVWTHRAQGGG